jgi:hypothetical protein
MPASQQLGGGAHERGKDTTMEGERETMGVTRGAGDIAADGDAGTTSEAIARRLEDAVERSMSDFESEHAVRNSLRPGLNDECDATRLDTVAGER